VMLLTPPNTHLDLVRQAVSAGKHVLLEKPLEIDLDRAQTLVAVAEEAGIKLGIVLQHRFRPISVALSGMITKGGSATSSAPRRDSTTGGRKAITTSRAGAPGRATAAACCSPRRFTRST
jgi:predicted dehydrogenase